MPFRVGDIVRVRQGCYTAGRIGKVIRSTTGVIRLDTDSDDYYPSDFEPAVVSAELGNRVILGDNKRNESLDLNTGSGGKIVGLEGAMAVVVTDCPCKEIKWPVDCLQPFYLALGDIVTTHLGCHLLVRRLGSNDDVELTNSFISLNRACKEVRLVAKTGSPRIAEFIRDGALVGYWCAGRYNEPYARGVKIGPTNIEVLCDDFNRDLRDCRLVRFAHLKGEHFEHKHANAFEDIRISNAQCEKGVACMRITRNAVRNSSSGHEIFLFRCGDMPAFADSVVKLCAGGEYAKLDSEPLLYAGIPIKEPEWAHVYAGSTELDHFLLRTERTDLEKFLKGAVKLMRLMKVLE